MELPVKNLQGQVVGSLQVAEGLFDVPFHPAVVHQVMLAHLANRRVGTHSTKTRSEVSGGGRKPWPQKHTGRARQGSTRAPQWRHGGIVFGPKPRDYHQAIPRRMRHLALRSLLSQKVRDSQLTVVEDLTLSDHKTKEAVRLLETLGIRTKCLVVSGDASPLMVRAVRNLSGVKAVPAYTINTLDLLTYDHLLMSVAAVRKAEELWGTPWVRPRGRMALVAAGAG